MELIDKKVIIIATYGRSGSTLLGAIIEQCAETHMAGENKDALRGLFHSVRNLSIGKQRAKQFKTGQHEPWYLIDKVNIERYIMRLLEVFFQEVVQAREDANAIGFKEIRFFDFPNETQEYFKFILDNIPNAYIIFNTRNLDDVCKSGWYKRLDPEKVKSRLSSYEKHMHACKSYCPTRVAICHYDDYTKDPEALRDMFEIINAYFDPEEIRKVLAVPLTHGKDQQNSDSNDV